MLTAAFTSLSSIEVQNEKGEVYARREFKEDVELLCLKSISAESLKWPLSNEVEQLFEDTKACADAAFKKEELV